MQIPEGVSPDGLRKQRYCAAQWMKVLPVIWSWPPTRIERLREVIRKVKLLATCESLSIDGYRNAMGLIRAETE
jgi:hypothetical protein